ncbi:uncharacterized protein FA14DRAFT_153935 [Meira miltonrushii]|uniref:BZIP domain-containing protein n=1 Tax=Meira miltonrushii TaxID=1280837 RepID=A0A316VM26_9BASI|nr:uncharacterized protein FA14DRAFT_153935 [Meira miltonrushii]PWN38616.1 hypothetical protein FA14DRAFT_153935 [Meira miltonrushii]
MPAPRKSSITSDEYMEIRRQQNKDAQRRWREKKRIEKEAEEEISRSKVHSTHKKVQKERSRNASTSTGGSSPKQVATIDMQQHTSSPQPGYHSSNAPHPAYAPAFQHSMLIEPPYRRTSLAPPFDPMLGRRLLIASQHPTFNLANLSWSEVIALAYQQSPNQEGTSPGLTLPFSNFAQAFVENARMVGMDVGYACDPSSSSFISQDCAKYQSDKRFGDMRRRNSMVGPHSNGLRKRAESNASSSSSAHSPRNGFGENGFTHLPPPSTLMDKRLRWENIPLNMHPTEAQLRIDHHPFIDIAFPWPSMREKILTMLASSIIDEGDLCDDCFQSGLPGNPNQEPAFLIWGTDYSDPFAWEVGEKFAQKWWFLLDEEIIYRSNWWRKQRGLPALQRGERKARLL